MFDILHIILMGLLNLVIGLFIGILIGSWDYKEKEKLTSLEEKVYISIKQYIKKNKKSPTYREISKMIGCSSSGTVGNIMKNLKIKGYIDYKEYISRTIKLKK